MMYGTVETKLYGDIGINKIIEGMIEIERMDDLFDKEVIDEMLEPIDDVGCCHYNAAKVCVNFDDWDVKYVEGYLGDKFGHAINSVKFNHLDKEHYFDVTQEYYIREGLKEDFETSFEVVKELSTAEVNEIFSRDGATHLIATDIYKVA